MAHPPHRDDPDAAFAAVLRAGPKDFAEQLHERVRRVVEAAVEESLDTRGAVRGWAELGPLQADGRRP